MVKPKTAYYMFNKFLTTAALFCLLFSYAHTQSLPGNVMRGKLVGVHSAIFPLGHYFIEMMTDDFHFISMLVSSNITIQNEKLLLYTEKQYADLTLSDKEPEIFYRTDFLNKIYQFTYTEKPDHFGDNPGGRYFECSVIDIIQENLSDSAVAAAAIAKMVSSRSVILRPATRAFDMEEYIALADEIEMKARTGKFDTEFLTSSIRNTFSLHTGFKKVQHNTWANADRKNCSVFKVYISDIVHEYKHGTAPIIGSFGGYQVKIHWGMVMLNGATMESTTYAYTSSGGNPLANHDLTTAYKMAVNNVKFQIKNTLAVLYCIYADNFIISDKTGKGKVKEIEVYDIGEYMDPDIEYGVILVDDNGYKIEDGVFRLRRYVAKGKAAERKNMMTTSVKLKINEGGDQIEAYIGQGKQLHLLVVPYYMLKKF